MNVNRKSRNAVWGNSCRNNFLYDDENQLVQWFSYYNPNGCPLMSGDERHDFVYGGLRLSAKQDVPTLPTLKERGASLT